MSSILPNYQYDIFISYRQNDNHSDKWVSNFVNSLKEELEATLKNPVSIYFDENPHDGLLETHQVDASLAKKLKCLVFIPIISQTYCDKTSFAWEHEFLPFVEMAKKDELGMNIPLSNGNVVSRILPIKIHELDNEDLHTLESVLDGPLRSIDFIYQQPGVNRPLRSKEDNPNNNLNKTFYRDQINKLANALKDIGASLLKQSEGKVRAPLTETVSPPVIKSSNKGVYIGLAAILIALLSYWGYRQFYTAPVEENVTLAVLAFDDQSPNGDQEWLGDGVADEILNVLAKVNGLQVTGKTSSFSFKGKDVTIKEIGKALNVTTVLEGSVSKVGNKLRITAQLIDVETDKHIWSNKYDRDAADIFNIMDEVAQSIAISLKSELSIEELKEININQQVNPEAYEHYLRGVYFHLNKFYSSFDLHDLEKAEEQYILAISIDSTYAEAYNGLALLYTLRAFSDLTYRDKRDSVISISHKINPNSAYLLAIKGVKFYNSYTATFNFDSIFHFLKKAYSIDPDFSLNNLMIANAYVTIGAYDIGIKLINNILIKDPLNVLTRQNLANAYLMQGLNEESEKECLKILEIDANNTSAYWGLFEIAVFHKKDKNEAERLLKELQGIPVYKICKAETLAMEGKKKEALSLDNDWTVYSLLNMKEEALEQLDSISSAQEYQQLYSYNCLLNMKRTELIREDPKFKEILAKAKVVYDKRMAKYGHLFDEE